MFAVIGNFLGKTMRNSFVAVWTPWTISNEEVWLRTNRFGGRLLIVAGLGFLLTALLNLNQLIPLVILILIGLILYVYSYITYRKVTNARRG